MIVIVNDQKKLKWTFSHKNNKTQQHAMFLYPRVLQFAGQVPTKPTQ